jgi:hypothetical protein
MKLFKFLGLLAYHLVAELIRLGAVIINVALDCAFGPPQIARAAAARSVEQVENHRAEGDFKPTVQVTPPPEAATDKAEESAPAPNPLRKEQFKVADRVRTAQLCGPHGLAYGRMWLYLYPEHGEAKRALKITDQHLARALRKDRFYLADVPYDAAAGHHVLFDEMHKECKALLDQRKTAPPELRKAFAQQPVPRPAVVPVPQQTVAPKVAVVEPALATPVPMASGAPAAVATPGGRRVRGDEYKGVVTVAGQTRRGTGEKAYDTFCLTLHDGVREVPLFGTELERQAADLGIKPGDNVRVVFMGKAPTQVPGHARPSYKNLYQLTRTERP